MMGPLRAHVSTAHPQNYHHSNHHQPDKKKQIALHHLLTNLVLLTICIAQPLQCAPKESMSWDDLSMSLASSKNLVATSNDLKVYARPKRRLTKGFQDESLSADPSSSASPESASASAVSDQQTAPVAASFYTQSNDEDEFITSNQQSSSSQSQAYSALSVSLATLKNKLNRGTLSLGHSPQNQHIGSSSYDQQSMPQQTFVNFMNSTSNSCGRQQVTRESKIVGGDNTYEGEFPWAVSIQRHGNHHCGGVIVGRRWILTAAHCVRSQFVNNLIVRVGGHNLMRSNSLYNNLVRDYVVDQIIIHEDFSRYDHLTMSQTKSSANTNNADIALLRLKQDIIWNEHAWPVCFPSKESGNFAGHDAVVIGWGKLSEKSEDFSNDLQKVRLTIIDNKVCQNWFRQAGRDMPIDDRIICAGYRNGGKDACHGDSGGPLLSRINGHYVVVGVVSTGIGCARPLLPGLYSRVSSYVPWIEKYVLN